MANLLRLTYVVTTVKHRHDVQRMACFYIGKDSRNGLEAYFIGLFAPQRMPDIFHLLNVILPDVPG